jgi:protocatechuate 3,4-dioxygenase beta subunit
MPASDHPSRRVILGGALAAGSLTFPLPTLPHLRGRAGRGAALAQELAPTPQCHDGDHPTERQIEGPFYRPSSPERSDLLERGAKAREVELAGTVLTRSCKPVSRVLIDLWHADETGEYDNRGFRYRGHVFTDAAGRFSFRTIRPAPYPGRTRHYHVKVLATGRQLLTTQLYFPNEPLNARDEFYSRALELEIVDAGEATKARFDFVLNLR